MLATGWDQGSVFAADVLSAGPRENSNVVIIQRFREFLENFRTGNVFTYRDQISRNVNAGKFYVDVDMSHLAGFNQSLASNLQDQPLTFFPLFEQIARDYAKTFYHQSQSVEESSLSPLDFFQVMLRYSSNAQTTGIRNLGSGLVGKLVRIPGIVISASPAVTKPSHAYVMCRSCFSHRLIPITGSFGGVSLPRTCSGPAGASESRNCGIDPFFLVPDRSACVDQQTLKLQEAPDSIPVGELPRHILLTVDRFLVNNVSPGARVTVNGIFSIFQSAKSAGSGRDSNDDAAAIRSPYLKVLGLESVGGQEQSAMGRPSSLLFSDEEERSLVQLSRSPNLLRRFTANIAPSIYGNEDIKLAIACLLFGGSRKFLPDGMKIRGDINVLLLGDPGVAKSQLLKFVEKVAPIAVYTSGKGSSAAGLTASVIRDPGTGEFYLEGGAMVLADGGVVCIDEFDKMNEEDRVAIHEAMEQQTISIAKAGITTILNSRTSVLAAANPLFGRYDAAKSPGDNIDFSATILSRFDMIFIVRDEHDVERDALLAKHVISVHTRGSDEAANVGTIGTIASSDVIDTAMMRRYVAFCRARCAPRLSTGAAEKLTNHYVSIRGELQEVEAGNIERSSIPITVRQLEAIVRITESLAKITLSPIATEEHVDEAIRLFRVSTMQAVLSGHSLEGMARPDLVRQMEKVERALQERIPIGSTVSLRSLVREMCESRGFPEHAVLRCIDFLARQEKLQYRSQQKLVTRLA